MSSTVSAGSINPWVTPITMGYLPREGTREANSQYNWTVQSSYTDDLTQLQSVAGMSTIQGVVIHNRGNTQSVTLTVAGTGQSITCPARSEATFPLIMGMTAPQVTITVNGASTATTRCNWLNYPVSAAVWAAPPLDPPTLDLSFIDGSTTIPPMTFARAGTTATYFDNTGTMQGAAANFPRIDWGPTPGATPLGLLIEENRTNSIRNPRAEGSTVGVIGSGGVVPTNWTIQPAAGLSVAVVGTGIESGIPYADIRYFGTTTASGNGFAVYGETNGVIAASVGQPWSSSFYWRLVGGTIPTNMAVGIFFAMTGNAGTAVTSGIPLPTSAPLASQRIAATTTTLAATTAINAAAFITVASGIVVDITIRIGGPQLELGNIPTSLILPAVGTPAAAVRGNDNAAVAQVIAAQFSIASEQIRPVVSGSIGATLELDDGSTTNRALTFAQSNSFNAFTGASPSVNFALGTVAGGSAGVITKVAAAFQPGVQSGCLNGGAVAFASPPAATLPTGMTTIRIGSAAAGNQFFNGYIRRVRYWPRVLGSGEMQADTT